jgi:hypothetical protein
LAIETVGEFVSDDFYGDLVPLAEITNAGSSYAFESANVTSGAPTIGVDYPILPTPTPLS